ncbi:MAG: GNAT family N-acetyltransferase [Thermoplasmata archaeon]
MVATPSTGSRSAADPSILVRELRWSDFDQIRETFYLLFDERETQPEIGITLFDRRPSIEDEASWFASLFRRAASGEAIVAVAEHHGMVVGQCTISRVGPTAQHEAAHVGELGILVHRDHRGAGVGRALLESALGQARGTFEVVRLSVFSVNTRARRLYERCGFVYIGSRPAAVKRGERYFDEDLMVLDLRSRPANR